MVELMTSMQYIQTLFIITFFACAVSLGTGMILDYLLFKSLKKNHPTYYESIGKPRILAPVNLTEEGCIQTLRGGVFGYIIIFRGLPKNFPKDVGLRKLAQAIRIVLTILLISFTTLSISGYFFYNLLK